MIKKLKHLALVLMVTGCTTAPPPATCPNMALDTDKPNFQAHYDYTLLSNLYSCKKQNMLSAANTMYGYKTWTNNPVTGNLKYQALDYQWNLWQQIQNGTLSRTNAQSEWTEFANKEEVQQAQLDASHPVAIQDTSQAGSAYVIDQDEVAAAAQAQADIDNQPAQQSTSYSNPRAGKGRGSGVTCKGNKCTSF